MEGTGAAGTGVALRGNRSGWNWGGMHLEGTGAAGTGQGRHLGGNGRSGEACNVGVKVAKEMREDKIQLI